MFQYFRNIIIMHEPGTGMVLNDRVNKPTATYKCLVKSERIFITAKLKWVRTRQKEHIALPTMITFNFRHLTTPRKITGTVQRHGSIKQEI